MSPVEVNAQGGGRPQLLPQPRTFTSQTSPGAISMPQTDPTEKSRGPRGARVAAAYYPSPFQKHYDQLGEQYLSPPSTHSNQVNVLLTTARTRVRRTSRSR